MKTTVQINAEKALKPRPDLLPAGALLALGWLEETPVTEAYDALLQFRDSPDDVDRLVLAMQYVANVIGTGVLLAGGRVMSYGAHKHGNCTWRVAGSEQADPQTHLASAERHLLEYLGDPAAVEEGSGFPVLWHAFSQICIVYDLVTNPPLVVGENDGLGTVTKRCVPELEEQGGLRNEGVSCR
jgi:hypothetical protein